MKFISNELQSGSGSNHYRYNVSLSTMWGIVNCSSLEEIFVAADKLGFAFVEFNHMVDSAMVNSMNLDGFPISSIHEPCPADISTIELKEKDWMVSSTNEVCRQKGVEAIRRSIELAHRLKVQTIVMHCGPVLSQHKHEETLRELFRRGQAGSDHYQELKNNLIEERSRSISAHFAAVKKSLTELLEYAGQYDIRIGLENRYHFLDIPLQDEMQELLEMADEKKLGFIYDVGHAQALDRLGFQSHEMWLKRFSPRMFGAHLHDVRGIDDHMPPGMGEIDYRMVAGYLHPNAFRTCEIHGKHTFEQIQDGLRVLADTGCIQKAG